MYAFYQFNLSEIYLAPESPLSIYIPTARSSPDRSSFSRGALSAPVAPNLAPFAEPKKPDLIETPPLTFQMVSSSLQIQK